jgi:hypothetical protein
MTETRPQLFPEVIPHGSGRQEAGRPANGPPASYRRLTMILIFTIRVTMIGSRERWCCIVTSFTAPAGPIPAGVLICGIER